MAETEVHQAAETEEVSIGVVSTKEFKEARAKGEMTVTRPVETESEEVESEGDAKSKDEEKPKGKGGGFQKRIDRLTKETHSERELRLSAEKRADTEKELRLAAEKRLADFGITEKAEEQVQVSDPTTDFPDWEDWKLQPGKSGRWKDYLAQYDAWKEVCKQADEQKAVQKERDDAYAKRLIEARAKHPDWDEIVNKFANAELPIPPKVGEAIRDDMDNGPDVVLFLMKNPTVREELLEMTPSRAVARIMAISEELAGETKIEEKEEEVEEKEEVKEIEEKPKSKAAPPIKPVGGSNTKSSVPLGEADMKSYKARRAAGQIR